MNRSEKLVDNERVQVERLSLGPLGTNAYVIVCGETKESALVDAPAEAGAMLDTLERTTPRYILLTHSHPDHVGALAELKEKLQVPLGAHPEEAANLPIAADLFLEEGDKIEVGRLQLEVLYTPGHTAGSICFRLDGCLFAGDTLFPGGPGKTFSPEGFQQIITSITQKIFPLPDETLVLPGHGESTVVKKEKEGYRVFSSRTQQPGLFGDVVWIS